jgi:thiosulfate/3-mercaptopyruvate sulfurtransferase
VGGVRYLRPEGAQVVDLPTAAGPEEVHLGRDDVLVVATKTQDADLVLSRWAGEPVGTGSHSAGEVLPVFLLQNGLEVERGALRRFSTVVGSVAWVPSSYVVDGEVLSPGAPARGIFWLGDFPDAPASLAAHRIGADLVAADFEVQVVDDLSRWLAGKLLGSVTFVLDALYPPSAERDRAARLVQAEAREVLESAGWDPADLRAEATVQFDRFATQPVEGRTRAGSSTFQSLARGRDAETEYLNGEIVLLARELGRRAPLNAALVGAIEQVVRAGGSPGTLSHDHLAQVLAGARVFVDAETLQAELNGAVTPALIDVRWTLGDPEGELHYLEGHLPGAVYADLDKELASPPSAAAGRHPLPAVGDLQQAARGWGVRAGRPVVVYDDNGGMSAARAWWLLRWAGVADVRILDGGIGAWRAAGGELETGALRPQVGDVELRGGHLPVLDADEAAALASGDGILVDARAAERYRGETEPIDARAGHVPGAISLPTAANLTKEGTFLPVAELRERFSGAGIGLEPGGPAVGVYCGSGVTAAHEIAALMAAGIDAALYPGSWSEWSADADRLVAVGADPS